jgi:hypothetical protein
MSMQTQRGNESIALTNLDPGTRWGGWYLPCTSHLYSQERDLVPIVQEAGWASVQVWTGTGTPMGFKPWIIQPVVSYYTNYTILAINNYCSSHKPLFPIRPYPFQLQCL